jgi:hypothetical protein
MADDSGSPDGLTVGGSSQHASPPTSAGGWPRLLISRVPFRTDGALAYFARVGLQCCRYNPSLQGAHSRNEIVPQPSFTELSPPPLTPHPRFRFGKESQTRERVGYPPCFGISDGGGKPATIGSALTRTAMEGDNGSLSFGVKKRRSQMNRFGETSFWRVLYGYRFWCFCCYGKGLFRRRL